MAKADITIERLRELLHYEPTTGRFTWLVDRSIRVRAGDVAGYALKLGRTSYIYVCIDERQYRAHRLAWFYMTGRWPEAVLDHIDGDGSNNRWDNLREATVAQNAQAPNRRLSVTNTSGYQGVRKPKGRTKWQAMIQANGKQNHLGYFDTPQEAYEAYLSAKRRLHAFCEAV